MSLEKLLKFSGAALALTAALGVPAATLQYVRLGIPLHLLTRDESLRAGVLPAIPLTAFLLLSYLTIKHTTKSGKLYWGGYPMLFLVSLACGLIAIAMFLALLMLSPVFPISVYLTYKHHGLRAAIFARHASELLPVYRQLGQQPMIWADWVIMAMSLLFLLFMCAAGWTYYTEKRHPKATETPKEDLPLLIPQIGFWLVCTLVVFWVPLVVLEVMVAEVDPAFHLAGLPNHNSWLGSPLIAGIELGFIACCYPLYLASTKHLPSGKRVYTLVAGLFCIYGAFVTGYASYIYPRLPHAIYGGKPSRVTFWYDEKTVLQSLGQTVLPRLSLHQDGSLTRCDGAYLVYTDSEVFIIADSDRQIASSVVLRRNSITAIRATDY